jgi:hypothetical protein
MSDLLLDDKSRLEVDRRVEEVRSRADLEALRDVFTRRLHRRSNDFDATHGLRVVSASLQRHSLGVPVVSRSS